MRRKPPKSEFFAPGTGLSAKQRSVQHYGEEDTVQAAFAAEPLLAPSATALPYYEATVTAVRGPTSTGFQRTVAVGVASSVVRGDGWLPGWDARSVALHGDDGNAFFDNRPTPLLPRPLAEEDTVGVGLTEAGCVYFTLNGEFLGVPFPDARFQIPMHPCVGLDANAVVTLNTGQEGFRAEPLRCVLQAREALVEAAAPAFPRLTEALNRLVIAFAVGDPADVCAITRINRHTGAVWGRVQESQWRLLSFKRFPYLQTRAVPMRNWARFYRRRAQALAPSTAPFSSPFSSRPAPDAVPSIENCGLQRRLAHGGLPKNFQWMLMCPVAAGHLRPAGEGRVFCDVCREHVHAVHSEEELAQHVDQVHCVAIDFQHALVTEVPEIAPRRPMGAMRGKVARR